MSEGVNCLASSTTWVDSALWGSQAEALFCLPASGPATANSPIQKARTTHLLQRPQGRAAIRRAPLMQPPLTLSNLCRRTRSVRAPRRSSRISPGAGRLPAREVAGGSAADLVDVDVAGAGQAAGGRLDVVQGRLGVGRVGVAGGVGQLPY